MLKMYRLTGKKGFTLVEALISSMLLAISLFVVGVAIYAEFSFINQNREKAIATLAAQEEIENIRGMSFDVIKSLGSSFTASGFTYLKDPVGTITVDDVYGAPDIRRVSVTVSWSSLAGRTLQKQLVTLMTRSGINKQ